MAQPFFIVGFQRSGTTLLRLMLDAHPDIAVPLDTVGLWSRYEAKLAAYGNLGDRENRGRIVRDLLAEERIALWGIELTAEKVLAGWTAPGYPGLIAALYELNARAQGKSMWGDKDPGNMTRVDQLNRWFPEGRIIHIIRDGRDACLSHLEQSFGFDDLLECASSWREEVQWVRRMGGILGSRYHELKYEDLVGQPAECLQRLCRFLGVPYREEMLSYPDKVARAVPDSKRHIWPLIDQAPRADNAGRWKQRLSSGQRICFEKRAQEVLAGLGYEVLPRKASGAYLEEMRSMAAKSWKAIARRLRPGQQGAR